MKLGCKFFDEAIDINDGTLLSIIIENPSAYFDFIKNLSFLDESEDFFSVFDGSTNYDIEKNIFWIENITSFDPNSKKNQGLLIQKIISKVGNNYDFQTKLGEVNNTLRRMILSEIADFDVGISINEEFPVQDVLKLYNIRLCVNEESHLNTILDIFKMIDIFVHPKIIVVSNLFSLLSIGEIEAIKKEIEYLKLIIVSIDTNVSEKEIQTETYILDKERCFIRTNNL